MAQAAPRSTPQMVKFASGMLQKIQGVVTLAKLKFPQKTTVQVAEYSQGNFDNAISLDIEYKVIRTDGRYPNRHLVIFITASMTVYQYGVLDVVVAQCVMITADEMSLGIFDRSRDQAYLEEAMTWLIELEQTITR